DLPFFSVIAYIPGKRAEAQLMVSPPPPRGLNGQLTRTSQQLGSTILSRASRRGSCVAAFLASSRRLSQAEAEAEAASNSPLVRTSSSFLLFGLAIAVYSLVSSPKPCITHTQVSANHKPPHGSALPPAAFCFCFCFLFCFPSVCFPSALLALFCFWYALAVTTSTSGCSPLVL
ncbi:hypothetical protein S245_029558, partial [Arachis hypogaea]